MKLPDEALRRAEEIYQQGRRDGGVEMVTHVLSDVFAALSERPDTKRQRRQRTQAGVALKSAADRLGLDGNEVRQMIAATGAVAERTLEGDE